MNLEPYAPAASLLILGLMVLVAFVRVRMLMRRYGLTELYSEEKTAGHVPPWWATHLDDYTREPPVVPAVPQPAPVSVPEPAEATHAPDEEKYVMTAPVELWFGDWRVAVRAGSDTDARFQRFAKVLLDDLRAAQERA